MPISWNGPASIATPTSFNLRVPRLWRFCGKNMKERNEHLAGDVHLRPGFAPVAFESLALFNSSKGTQCTTKSIGCWV